VALPADDLIDAVVVVLNTAPPPPPSGSTVTVEAADVPTLDPDKLPKGDLRVWVYWPEYDPGSPASRAADTLDVTVVVVAAERFTDAGAVPLAWRRERSDWFQAFAVDRLNDPRREVGGFYPAEAERVAFDRDMLTAKVFWTAFTVTLRRAS